MILNALVNATNSDYINASTVTDHDPRNPSFIVTQGPLGQNVADFWQMVWEQGCVVIVMLTRLQDNGYQLCTRYWPEEGSEQYHIFEVCKSFLHSIRWFGIYFTWFYHLNFDNNFEN